MHAHSSFTHRFRLPPLAWLLPLLGSILLAACGGGHEVVYSCGGSATDASVSYVGGDGETVEETVTIPWEQVIQRSGDDFGLRFEAENLGDSGDLACRVLIDGREVAGTTWEETLSITVDYSKSGSSTEWSSSTSGTARVAFTQDDLDNGLEVRNLTPSTVCEFYAIPTSESGWGTNHLAGQPPIEADGNYVIPDFAEGSYNVKAVDCEGNIPAWQFQINLGPGSWVSVNPVEEGTDLTLVNNSSQDICGFYMEHSVAGSLPNLFTEGASVPAGSSIFVVVPPEVTRLTAEPCKGSGVATLSDLGSGGPPATWEITDDQFADAVPVGDSGVAFSLKVVNDSPNALCGVYITLPDQPWGENRFPAGTRLETGEFYTITGLTAQNFDVKTVTCEGDIPSFGINTDYVGLVEQYGTSLTYTISGVPNTVVQNHSSVDLCGVAIGPTGASDWFRNLLSEGQPLASGEEITFFMPGGQFDLSAWACNGTTVVAPDQPIPEGYTFEVVD